MVTYFKAFDVWTDLSYNSCYLMPANIIFRQWATLCQHSWLWCIVLSEVFNVYIDPKSLPRNQRIFRIIVPILCPNNVSITDSTVCNLQRNIATLHWPENCIVVAHIRRWYENETTELIAQKTNACHVHLNFCSLIRPKMPTHWLVVSINCMPYFDTWQAETPALLDMLT